MRRARIIKILAPGYTNPHRRDYSISLPLEPNRIGPGSLVPRDDPGHERVRSDRIRLEGARHHRVDDLILGGHVLAFLGTRSGFQPAIVRAHSLA